MSDLTDRLRMVRGILETITISSDLAVSGLAKIALTELLDPAALGEVVGRLRAYATIEKSPEMKEVVLAAIAKLEEP